MLVRYLVKDDEKQAEKAFTYIKRISSSGELLFISSIVLCELVWVLESAYEYKRTDIADVLEKILMIKQFEIDSKDVVRQAVRDYRNGRGDIADYLIGRINHVKGCDKTATFDHSLKNSAFFSVLD